MKRQYGEGVRGARSSSEYRRGVYAALIVGTTPPISFAESFSIRQFLFFIYLLLDRSIPLPLNKSIYPSIVYRLSVIHVFTTRQSTASSIPRSPLFLDIIAFGNTAFVLTLLPFFFFDLIVLFYYPCFFIAVPFYICLKVVGERLG